MIAFVTPTAALDAATVDVITNGRFSDAGKAIGNANLATLQAAAQTCTEAAKDARRRGGAFRQYQDRAQLCRGRIRKIVEKEKARS